MISASVALFARFIVLDKFALASSRAACHNEPAEALAWPNTGRSRLMRSTPRRLTYSRPMYASSESLELWWAGYPHAPFLDIPWRKRNRKCPFRGLIKPLGEDLTLEKLLERLNLIESHSSNQWLTNFSYAIGNILLAVCGSLIVVLMGVK
jgi:hypothetical protein